MARIAESVCGLTGFGSFLPFLGYGYLDQWHLWATLFLLSQIWADSDGQLSQWPSVELAG